ncbi:virion morphogenesis protein [Burkholderia pseudomallei]|uniref:phage virion morphogenesis protein n=1 Tax=Burkholderia pseudomallei TaxID=28450 RepID=UPI0005386AC9|nr:phage virion morphogenesis protein [Burkholderia pseudomallei]KGX76497.1 phage virion morphogenesis protein [Burkholderia pseudomallei MSHR435]AJX22452.1 phage virion morphogenesis protein [Burkholderia pseudomallei MSHR491]KGW87694.1 phage virion morphogenesis protein [Burkholderia pseudomallei MSHR456]KGW90501.1 phage virion morphogenesis protein [Burkholderia pseudomallei MSHR449]ONC08431.1 virion morphogenesis protein [Burkholderia pseudomallei]
MIEIQVDDTKYEAAMARVHALMQDASPITSLIAALMLDAVEENFAQQGRPKWLGLSPKTLKRRREEAGTGKILQRSGRLASSVTSTHDATSARVGTNVVYAAIHQFGGTIQRHPMSGYVRLRKGRDGMIMRQANHPHLAVFAKNGHKRVKIVKWTRSQGWTIKIPARPFLVLTEADNIGIESEVTAYLRRLFDQ